MWVKFYFGCWWDDWIFLNSWVLSGLPRWWGRCCYCLNPHLRLTWSLSDPAEAGQSVRRSQPFIDRIIILSTVKPAYFCCYWFLGQRGRFLIVDRGSSYRELTSQNVWVGFRQFVCSPLQRFYKCQHFANFFFFFSIFIKVLIWVLRYICAIIKKVELQLS